MDGSRQQAASEKTCVPLYRCASRLRFFHDYTPLTPYRSITRLPHSVCSQLDLWCHGRGFDVAQGCLITSSRPWMSHSAPTPCRSNLYSQGECACSRWPFYLMTTPAGHPSSQRIRIAVIVCSGMIHVSPPGGCMQTTAFLSHCSQQQTALYINSQRQFSQVPDPAAAYFSRQSPLTDNMVNPVSHYPSQGKRFSPRGGGNPYYGGLVDRKAAHNLHSAEQQAEVGLLEREANENQPQRKRISLAVSWQVTFVRVVKRLANRLQVQQMPQEENPMQW